MLYNILFDCFDLRGDRLNSILPKWEMQGRVGIQGEFENTFDGFASICTQTFISIHVGPRGNPRKTWICVSRVGITDGLDFVYRGCMEASKCDNGDLNKCRIVLSIVFLDIFM